MERIEKHRVFVMGANNLCWIAFYPEGSRTSGVTMFHIFFENKVTKAPGIVLLTSLYRALEIMTIYYVPIG
jgi:hypothetical protein